MNKLVLVGNGFDLAHGLNTRYNDFVLWYFNWVLTELVEKKELSDQLIEISFSQGRIQSFPSEVTSINGFKELLKNHEGYVTFRIKCALFKILYNKTIELNWVEIEYEYYSYLKSLFDRMESNSFRNSKKIEAQVKVLNSDFEYLKKRLQEYLNIVESSKKTKIPDIVAHFKNCFAKLNNNLESNLFLNFNYTSTIEMYLDEIKHDKYAINYIHGKLNDERNPIIFGYGDEIDSYYQKIENINYNAFLKNFKSFGYLLTSNYQKFSVFLERYPFEVYILGHSCGLSDRTMLNKIVEHDNCRRIKIFYYKISSNENDFIEKTYELSRHFSPNKKTRMRDIIEPFPESKPLVDC